MPNIINPKRFVVFITFSLAELEVLLPICSRLKQEYNAEIEFIFAVKKFYEEYQQNDFYRYCVEQIGIKVSLRRLPNKFDFRHLAIAKNRVGALAIKSFFFLEKQISFLRLNATLASADYFMHEISNQTKSTEFMYKMKEGGGGRQTIITYHHGSGILIGVKVEKEVKQASEVIHLSFHAHNAEALELMGFRDLRVVGYTQFYPEYIRLVNKYSESRSRAQKYVLILSRHVHPFYMDDDKYEFLLRTTCQVVRKCLGDIRIVVKPHPRETLDRVQQIFSEMEIENYEFSTENPAVLAKEAMLSISYFGSSVLSALAMQVPAVEYFIEPRRFREAEVDGSWYKKFGVDSVETPEELEEFIERVKRGEYKKPEIVEELSRQHSFEFFKTI